MKKHILIVLLVTLTADAATPQQIDPSSSQPNQVQQSATTQQAVPPPPQQAPTPPANPQPSINAQQTPPAQPAKPKNCNLPGPLGGDPQKPTKPHRIWDGIRSRIYQQTGEDPNKIMKPKGCPDDPPPLPLPKSPAKPVTK